MTWLENELTFRVGVGSCHYILRICATIAKWFGSKQSEAEQHAHPRPEAPVRLVLDVRLKPLRHAHAAVDRGRCPYLRRQKDEEAEMRLRLACIQSCTSQGRSPGGS